MKIFYRKIQNIRQNASFGVRYNILCVLCSTFVVLFLSASCGPDKPEGLYDDIDRNDISKENDLGTGDQSGDAKDDTPQPQPLGSLTGTWLLVHAQSTCVIGTEQLATTDYLVEIRQEGSTLIEERKICGINLTPVLGTVVTIPPETRRSVTFAQIDRGFVSSTKTGGGYTSSTELNQWGLDLENPATDLLPTDPDDPVVIDSDEDGNPGVTFSLSDGDCERYASQRQIIRYHGVFTTPNQVDGSSVGLSEAVVFGATRTFCRIAPPIQPNDEHSIFRMVRIDGKGGSIDGDTNQDGEITCAEVRALAPTILERRDADPERCK